MTTSASDFDPPLTPEEQDTRDLLTNPKRERERKEWARETLQRWAETDRGKAQVEAWENATAERRRWPGRPKKARAA